MEAQLKAFLERCRIARGEPFTHTTKGTSGTSSRWTPGSYFIEDNYLDNFWTTYCNYIANNQNSCHSTVTERPGPYGPLRVDFDFKSSIDDGHKRKYTKHILKHIVKLYQKELQHIIDPEIFENTMLTCIVLEKPEPRIEEGKLKDGFHLHFPNFICEGWIQDRYLREKVSAKMLEEKVWGENSNFITPLSEFIDKDIARKPWMLYGSMNYKNKHSVPYLYNNWTKSSNKFGYAFDHNLSDIALDKIFEIDMSNRQKSVKYYLPRFLSIRGFTSATSLTDEIISQKTLTVGRKKRNYQITKKRTKADVMTDLKTIKDWELMSMLSNVRAENYDEWMDVGWTLFNIGQGEDDALAMWIEFSTRSSKFIDGECEKMWETMDLSAKTIASLFAMAKIDSPDDYNDMKKTDYKCKMWSSVKSFPEPNEYDVAFVVSAMYPNRFVCARAKEDIWYEFDDHRWRKIDGHTSMQRLLPSEVCQEYWNLHAEIAIKQKTADDSERVKLENQRKVCKKIIDRLKTDIFQKKVIKQLCILKEIHQPLFMQKIDENRKLLGCENGIIDLELGIFRDGRPDDYVTFSTGMYFRKYNPKDKEVKELDDYLLKVYPNEKRRKYFIDFMTSCMEGGNIHKRFLIATGPSDGAKSMTFSLLELVFGKDKRGGIKGYFGKFDRTLMVRSTGSNSSSGPRPELARVRGKRIMGAQEVTKEEKLNIGFIKEATGNDSFFARGLYEKDADEIQPMFTLLMQCNEPPEIPGQDEATWSRVRILDHESKFVKPQDLEEFPVPETFEEQLRIKRFAADNDIRDRLPNLAQVLLWKLFDNFKTYKTQGLIEPNEVLLSTAKYKMDNDIYSQFIHDRIEKEKDPDKAKTTFIKLAETFSEFGDWYKDNYPSYIKGKIGKNIMKHELNKRLGVITNENKEFYGFGKMSRWWGYKIVQDDPQDLQSFLGGD
uniref:D5-like helicase-primase n=1 Tax=Marseillevirus LCMAC102 TaxID=2506603 RepID=A0A481YSX9_9VIRU|nr:MAG: D5-like helicase-primase [Marseillevirus LCMAC102]